MSGRSSRNPANPPGSTPASWSAEIEGHLAPVVRLTPIVPEPVKEAYEPRSSLDEMRAQVLQAAQALAELTICLDAAVVLAPAGWARIAWPADRVALDGLGLDTASSMAEVDIGPKLPALCGWADEVLGEDLRELPGRMVVFGIDFADPHHSEDPRWEAQVLFVFAEDEAGIRRTVHATTKFSDPERGAIDKWLLASHDARERIWRGYGLLNCHDLSSVGQSRSEPTGILAERRNAVRKLFARRSNVAQVLHIAHTLGGPATWKKAHTALRKSLERPDLPIYTAGRYQRLLPTEDGGSVPNSSLERFDSLGPEGRDIVVRLRPASACPFEITKKGQAICTIEDWHRLAPPRSPNRQWQPGKSALSCAQVWTSALPNIPSEVAELLRGHPDFDDELEFSRAEPEYTSRIDDANGPPTLDVAVWGRDSRGPFTIGIEAKAGEPYGATVSSALIDARKALASTPASLKLERLRALTAILVGAPPDDPDVGELRYQLFTAAVGTAALAHRTGARRGVFVVHDLVTTAVDEADRKRNHEDLKRFLGRILGGPVDPGRRLLGPIEVAGPATRGQEVRLYVGVALRVFAH